MAVVRLCGGIVLLALACGVALGTPTSPFLNYLNLNVQPSGLPNSYYVPTDYFESIPVDERPHNVQNPQRVVACNDEMVQPENLNAYEFQTEKLLTSVGINLYDASTWTIAQSLLGNIDKALDYTRDTLFMDRTLQFGSLKGDRPCEGLIEPYGTCTDPDENGACGFCYGDDLVTLESPNAYYFRMVSDYFCLEGTVDERCPELGNPWCWNDYKPVTGENSWAAMIGALQTEYFAAGQDITSIDLDSVGVTLAVNLFAGVQVMQIWEGEGAGAVLYCPYNTWNEEGRNLGAEVSTENNVSLLAGLRMLYEVISNSSNNKLDHLLPELDRSVKGIESFIKASFDTRGRFFRQGLNSSREWVSEPFATDCQTWTMAILGLDLVEQWFGPGAALDVWNTTKRISGYNYNPATTFVDGVGFSENEQDQVLSGEWTFGAINTLRVLAQEYQNRGDISTAQALLDESNVTEKATRLELTTVVDFNGVDAETILYSNKRYWIPFGWWANPIPSLASTSWAVFLDLGYNPFRFGGAYESLDPTP